MADITPRNPNQSDPQPVRLPEDLSRAALIRAAADAEGNAADRLDSGNGSDTAMAFERDLREAVSRAMAEPAHAPQGLRDRILASFDREYAQHSASESDAIPAALPITEHKHPDRFGRKLSMMALFPRFAAIAAVLALSATLVYIGSQQFSNSAAPQSQTIAATSVANQLQFVQREHNRCSDVSSGAFASKIVVTNIDDCRAYAQTQLGCGGPRLAEAIERMGTAGYTLVGVGPCKVPGGGKSLHALFTPVDASAGLTPVSVFLLESPGEGCKNAKPGVCYSCPKSLETGKPAMLWRDGNLMVFVHSASEASIQSVRAAYSAPDAVESL